MVAAHAFDPSRAGLVSRVPGQPNLHRETLSGGGDGGVGGGGNRTRTVGIGGGETERQSEV